MTENDIRRAQMELSRRMISKEMGVMKKLLKPYRLFYSAELEDYTFDLLNRRLDRLPIRAYFIRKTYEYIKVYLTAKTIKKNEYSHSLHQLFTVKLAFIFEVIIVIQYLHNQILDQKFGVNNPEMINKNLIASNILRHILIKYIKKELKSFDVKGDLIPLVMHTVNEVLLMVDLGQRIDKDFNNYKMYMNEELPVYDKRSYVYAFSNLECIEEIIRYVKNEIRDRDHFIDIYFRRIYLTNICLFGFMSDLVLKITGYTGRECKRFMNFSLCYATVLQIVNDNADFAPIDEFSSQSSKNKIQYDTTAKTTNDVLCDLKNATITLPLIYHLDLGYNRLIEKYLRNRDINIIKQYKDEIIMEMVRGGLRKSMRVGRNIAKEGHKYLDSANPESKYFKSMLDIANINKYYRIFYRLK